MFEPGDLVLSKQKNLIHYPQAWITGCEWTHVDIFTPEDEAGNNLIGAVFPKVRACNLDEVEYYSVWRITCLNLEEKRGIADFALSKIGTQYDWVQFLLLGWRIIWDTLDKNREDPNPDLYVCSELVAEACLRYGLHFGKYVDNVLPRHIIESPSTTKIFEKPE